MSIEAGLDDAKRKQLRKLAAEWVTREVSDGEVFNLALEANKQLGIRGEFEDWREYVRGVVPPELAFTGKAARGSFNGRMR